MSSAAALAKIRGALWPIYGDEHKKFLPMAAMIALILFVYTMARDIKDALVVTNAGPETITFLKVWMVVPAAFLFFLIYSKLSNFLDKKTLFYVVIAPFIVFFVLFAFVLYPLREILHPHASADWLLSVLPDGFSGVISMYRYWTFSLFYATAEIWGSAVLSLMFWQFANDVIRMDIAKRFYAHFYLLANLAVSFAGFCTNRLSHAQANLPEGVDPWGLSLKYMMTVLAVCGIGVMVIYYYLTNRIFIDARSLQILAQKPESKKRKMSMIDGFRLLARSKHLGFIAILVLSYGVTINLVEVAWKSQIRLQYPNAADYSAFMGYLSFGTGLATFLMILVGSNVIRHLGWLKAALATPVILGFTGILFFMAVLFPEKTAMFTTWFGITPLFFAVAAGFAQNIMSKSTKYAMFDPTKEMAYIPLNDELKQKGKAAVDVVGARLGKSGGSFIQQAMFVFIGPIAVIMPYSAAIVFLIVLVWCMAAVGLNKRLNAEAYETEDAADEATQPA